MDIDEILARSLQSRISPREEGVLRKWRAADPEHESRYQNVSAIWRSTRGDADHPPTSPPNLEVIISEAAARRRMEGGRWGRRCSRAAAMVAALVAGIAVAQLWQVPSLVGVQAEEVVTGVGETTTARLSDGTVVRLAPESRLRLLGTKNTREVDLEGRAFFAVATDVEKPFLVRTPSGEARVLGTRFELDAQEEHLRVVVVEGRVAVGLAGSGVDVRSSQVGHLRTGQEASVVDVGDVWPLLGWMGSFLAFKATPLHEVRSELQGRFDVNLIFDDPTLGQETVTVWFGDEPLEDVVSVLCRLVAANCLTDDSIVRMSRRP